MARVNDNYTNKFFNTDFMKDLMPANGLLPFDLNDLLETQRKNMQAMTERIAHAWILTNARLIFLTKRLFRSFER